jgi:sec-independent protein translocase protein TatC
MPDPTQESSFVSHLVELRARLLRCVLLVALLLVALLPFASNLYTQVALPLLKTLPAGASMIATEVAAPFLAPFKLAAYLALFLAMPYVLYQAWAFVAPGLYRHEKRVALPLFVSSVVLFYLGAAFAYYLVFPLLFNFLSSVAPAGVVIMTDISRYLDFILVMFLAFGLAFEVPVAVVLLVWVGVITTTQLRRLRPYIIVAAFVIGAILTPPDVVSQLLLALPIWLLFEAGLLFSTWLPARRLADAAAVTEARGKTGDGPAG